MSLFKKKDKGDLSYDPNSSKNYSYLKGQKDVDTYRYRNVYEGQDLKRGEMGNVKSPRSRQALVGLVFLVLLFLSLFITSFLKIYKDDFYNKFVGPTFVVEGVTNSDNKILKSLSFTTRDTDLYTKEVTDNGWTKYKAVDLEGNPIGEPFDRPEDVPRPDWYNDAYTKYKQAYNNYMNDPNRTSFVKNITVIGFLISLTISSIVAGLMYVKLMKTLKAQNIMSETEDINQYEDDQHIALPEEVIANATYDFFPDAGAHAPLNTSTLISHLALSNKGINKVKVAKKAKEDIFDEDGDIIYYKGEVLKDDDGNILYDKKPMFDENFAHSIFDASNLPKDKSLRKFFNTSKINYNKGNEIRDRMKGYDTVADMINKTWTLPEYENQRPGGCYVVDTAPVNTMCLAIN